MAVVLVLLVSLLVVLLARDPGGTPVTQQTQTATVTTTSTVAAPVSRSPSPSATTGPTPSPSPDDSPSPEPSGPGQSLPPAPPGQGVVFQSGILDDLAGNHDLDQNDITCAPCDIEASTYGLAAVDGAFMARAGTKGDPLLPDCAKIPLSAWGTFVAADALRSGDWYCVVTDEDRFGRFGILGKNVNAAGELDNLALSFAVWKGLRD
jgi:hypothetical protein